MDFGWVIKNVCYIFGYNKFWGLMGIWEGLFWICFFYELVGESMSFYILG